MAKHKRKAKGNPNIFKSMRLGWQRFQKLDPATIGGLRNFLLIAMFADLLGIIGFLKMKTIGMFLFILILIFLVLVMIVERRYGNKMLENFETYDLGDEGSDETEEKKEDKEEPKMENIFEDKPLGNMGGGIMKNILGDQSMGDQNNMFGLDLLGGESEDSEDSENRKKFIDFGESLV